MTGLTPGLTYNFAVKARNRIGFSVQSTTISILAAQIPDPPLQFRNDNLLTSYNQIGLKWDAPEFDGGSQIIDYRVWTDRGLGGQFFVQQKEISQTELLIENLEIGTLYKFKIQARNALGFSDQ